MNRGPALLAAAALFTSGLAIGALGVHLFYSQQILGRMGPPLAAKPMGPLLEEWLERSLDLTDEQRDQVRIILADSRARAEELRHEVGPRLIAINQEASERISEVLTPAQQLEFDRMRERLEHRWQGHRRFRRGGKPGSPPHL